MAQLFYARNMGRSLLFIAIGITTLLQSAIFVNGAPSLAYIPRNNGPSSGAPGATNTSSSTSGSSTSSVTPAAIYNGSYANAHEQGVYLRIGNGGAGQSGLIRAFADAFIQYRVSQGDAPFEVSDDSFFYSFFYFKFINIALGGLVPWRHDTKSGDVS